MTGKLTGLGLLAAILLSRGVSWGGAAMPVSPGDANLVTVTWQNCPTFSWSSADEAAAYRIEVFELLTADAITHHQMRQIADPVISKAISSPALSWTPSEAECLDRGRQYIWYVQGVGADGNGQWSGSLGFRVDPAALTAEHKEALADAVREYLAAPEGRTLLSNALRETGPSGATLIESNPAAVSSKADDGTAAGRQQSAAIAPLAVSTGLTIDQNGILVNGSGVLSGASQMMLHISGSDPGGAWLNIFNTSTNGIESGRNWGLISTGYLNGEHAGKLLIRDNTANAVRAAFDTAGNFGLGTDAPSAKLDVVGNIKANNMPAIGYSQTSRGMQAMTNNTDVTLESITVIVPASGYLLLNATVDVLTAGGGIYGSTVTLRVDESVSGAPSLIAQRSQSSYGLATPVYVTSSIALNWVLVQTGPSTRVFNSVARWEGTDGQSIGQYGTSTLSAIFIPYPM